MHNHGKTPARLTAFGGRFWQDKGQPAKRNFLPEDNIDVPPGLAIPQGGTYDGEREFLLTEDEARKMWNSDINLIFYGTVKYIDVLGDCRETNFCWQWDVVDSYGWVIAHNQELNSWK